MKSTIVFLSTFLLLVSCVSGPEEVKVLDPEEYRNYVISSFQEHLEKRDFANATVLLAKNLDILDLQSSLKDLDEAAFNAWIEQQNLLQESRQQMQQLFVNLTKEDGYDLSLDDSFLRQYQFDEILQLNLTNTIASIHSYFDSDLYNSSLSLESGREVAVNSLNYNAESYFWISKKELLNQHIQAALWYFEKAYSSMSNEYVLSGLDETYIEMLYAQSLESNDPQLSNRIVDLANRFIQSAENNIVARLAGFFEDFTSGSEDKPFSSSSAAEGTVTVWVDKGIKLENGIGYADRVIGSGFFIDKEGHLLTNYHVISSEVDPSYEGVSKLFIRMPQNPSLRIPAKVIGYDRIFDIALLRAELDVPYVFNIRPSIDANLGDPIQAIGSPGGLESTITSGIISAVGRRFLQMGDSMQVDVPINPGNSGGPLIDSQGRVQAVVFAGIEQFEGINFAIPIKWVNNFLGELYSNTRDSLEVKHRWIGASVHENSGSVELVYIAPGSPAEKAGLEEGTKILAVNGTKINSILAMQQYLMENRDLSLITLSIQRKDETADSIQYINEDVLVALEDRPFSPFSDILNNELNDHWLSPLFGIKVETLNSSIFTKEFVITRVYSGSIADESGLSERDPFRLIDWFVDDEQGIAILQILIQKRNSGYLNEGLQLASFIEINSFI